MIEHLVVTLEQKFKDLTAEEIAEILWLTLQQWQSGSAKLSESQANDIDVVSPVVETLPPQQETLPTEPKLPPTMASSQSEAMAGITTKRPSKPTQSQTSSDLGAPLAIPDAPSLRRSLEILRALQPLIRLVPSANAKYLDLPATVKAIAETELWLLKLRPVLEPWLELALVVDASPSMVIWQRTILNLRRILAQSGVFRDVRLWSLESAVITGVGTSGSTPSIKLCIRSGFGVATATQPPCRPQELLDPNGRRLILVVSDCIDPRWDEQPLRDMLQVWANHGPMGLLQVLPEWLWNRTALSQVTKGQMKGFIPGQASQSLTFIRRERWRRKATVGVKVPVMTLEPAVANRWSQMVAGKASVSAPGLVFSSVTVQQLSASTEPDSSSSDESSPELTPQERLAQFRNFSSLMARSLAGLLAACPEINLPIVRMVQAALLPDSQQVHVAEVLFGGLFKPQIEITAHTPTDQVQYVFHEGVKSLVQDTIPPKQAFDALSIWVKYRFGYALEDFPAYLTAAQDEAIKPFAGLMLDVLNRQGSQYVNWVERITRLIEPDLHTPPGGVGSPSSFPPPLEIDEFIIKTVQFQPESTPTEELEVFKFTVATLKRRTSQSQRSKKGQAEPVTQWVIQRQQHKAYRFVETLADELSLEMVAIPAGTFLMGSPKNEPGRFNSESPQHKVTVEPFWMGRYPITQAQWRFVAALPQINRELAADPARFKGDLRPVEKVSWAEAVEFCLRLSQYSGRQYRLPTEAEWEYACRAGTTTPFHFGDMITTEVANYASSAYNEGPKDKRRSKTTPIDHFGYANVFGLSDMHGNVWEWCEDHWHRNYEGAPIDGSAWLTEEEEPTYVIRGGAWFNGPRICRSASRDGTSRAFSNGDVGLRVVCSAPSTLLKSMVTGQSCQV